MRLLEFDSKASLASVIEAIKGVPDQEVTLRVPADTPWLKNQVNEKILRKSVQQFGKEIHFEGRPAPEVKPIPEPKVTEDSGSRSEASEEKNPEASAPAEAVTDDAGFVVGGDVMAREEMIEAAPVREVLVEPKVAPAEPPLKIPTGGRFGRFGRISRGLFRRWYLSLIAAVGLLLILGAYVVYALPKADVNIVVTQRPLDRDATVTATTSVTAIDPDTRKIPAITKTATESGSLKITTTGKKTVGTNAAGTVTIYNKTNFAKSFPAGQQITSAGSTALKFTLSQAVTAPAETCTLSGCTFGTVDATVTAADIGSQYNLGAGTTFTVDGYDQLTYSGSNAAPMSGGTSRDIQVVSQADLDSLNTTLSKTLTDQATASLQSQAGGNEKAVTEANKVTVVSKTYNHQLGDEAGDVTLNLSLSVTTTLYSTEDMKNLLIQVLTAAAPDGYEVTQDGMETSADVSSVGSNGDVNFLGHIQANLVPKFDKDELARNLAGKKPAAAETYLKAIPSVVSYQVTIWPNLPDFFKAFPRDTKRIHINVKVQS